MAIKQHNPIPIDSSTRTKRCPEEFNRFITSSVQELKRGHTVVVFTLEQLNIIKGYFNNELDVVYNPVEEYWTL